MHPFSKPRIAALLLAAVLPLAGCRMTPPSSAPAAANCQLPPQSSPAAVPTANVKPPSAFSDGARLPGTTTGQFNRGLGRADLVRLVDQFNQNYARKLDPHGQIIPSITLPASYSFDHGYQSLDLRLTRTVVVHEQWRLRLIGEVFNLYNAANLSGYSNDLTTAGFGQPTARFTQLFGSGGPRAFQLAARISF